MKGWETGTVILLEMHPGGEFPGASLELQVIQREQNPVPFMSQILSYPFYQWGD